jgi:hypothetical protein
MKTRGVVLPPENAATSFRSFKHEMPERLPKITKPDLLSTEANSRHPAICWNQFISLHLLGNPPGSKMLIGNIK